MPYKVRFGQPGRGMLSLPSSYQAPICSSSVHMTIQYSLVELPNRNQIYFADMSVTQTSSLSRALVLRVRSTTTAAGLPHNSTIPTYQHCTDRLLHHHRPKYYQRTLPTTHTNRCIHTTTVTAQQTIHAWSLTINFC